MKCKNCGSELAADARFCRDCGSKIEPDEQVEELKPAETEESQKVLCKNCGAELAHGAIFCRDCGNRIEFVEHPEEPEPDEEESPDNAVTPIENEAQAEAEEPHKNETQAETTAPPEKEAQPEITVDKIPEKKFCKVCGRELNIDDEFCSKCGTSISKGAVKPEPEEKTKRLNFWARMSPFVKTASILLLITAILFAVSIYTDVGLSIILSVVQLLVLILSLLIHKKAVKSDKPLAKYSLLTVAVLFLIISILLTAANLLGCFLNRETKPVNPTKDVEATPAISITYAAPLYDSEKCIGRIYTNVRHEFTDAGFKNISEEPLRDLEITESDKNGLVESVEIDGKNTFRAGDEFDQNADVIIYYHAFKTACAPISSKDAVTEDAQTLEALFLNAGFTDIVLDEVTDLDPDRTDSEFENKVRIGTVSDFSEDDEFAINSKIKIITHYPYEKYTVKVSVNFVSNLFFSKYDVNFSINDVKEKNLAHGEDADFELRLEPGDYKLTFSSTESSSVKGETSIKVNSDVNAAYTIYCHSDNISVNTDYVENVGAAGEDEVMLTASASTYRGKNYKDVEKELKEAGFTNISTKILYDIIFGWTEEGETDKVSIDGKTDFKRGEIFSKDAPVVITYHMKEEDDPNNKNVSTPSSSPSPEPVYYSTNDKDTAKKGNSGMFAYKSIGGTYDNYWIIDFDEGYVYWFSYGNGETSCDRVKIVSGDLNDVLIITYHDGNTVWSYGLHFKWKNQPDTLILQDNDGFEIKYYTTDLSDALEIRDSMTIVDY